MSLWKKITYVPTDEEAQKSAENFVRTIKKWFPFAVMVLIGLIPIAILGYILFGELPSFKLPSFAKEETEIIQPAPTPGIEVVIRFIDEFLKEGYEDSTKKAIKRDLKREVENYKFQEKYPLTKDHKTIENIKRLVNELLKK